MDDFGVKYFSRGDADHILDSIKNHYAILTDWEGLNHFGFTIDYNYNKVYMNILMTDYVTKSLVRLQHPKPK